MDIRYFLQQQEPVKGRNDWEGYDMLVGGGGAGCVRLLVEV